MAPASTGQSTGLKTQADSPPEEDSRPDGGEPRLAVTLLACLCLLLDAGCFQLLHGPLNSLTARFPPLMGIFTRILLPTVLGTGLCAILPALLEDWGLMEAAFRRLLYLGMLLFAFLQILIWGEREAQLMIVHFFGHFVLFPVLSGLYVARRLRRRKQRTPDQRPPGTRQPRFSLTPRQEVSKGPAVRKVSSPATREPLPVRNPRDHPERQR